MVVYTLEQRLWVGLRSTYWRCRFWQKKTIFSDEAHFDLGAYVNKQICLTWGTENPHAYIEKPTQPKRVTVWCRFWSRGIIGPFFFENEQVNGDRYRAMLNEFLFTKIEEKDIDNIWFQQDDATCHTTKATTRCFAQCFRRSHYQPFFFDNEQGEPAVVKGDRYRAMLNEFLFTKIEQEDIGNIWFQQDGATCHTAEATLDILHLVFEDRIISRRADFYAYKHVIS